VTRWPGPQSKAVAPDQRREETRKSVHSEWLDPCILLEINPSIHDMERISLRSIASLTINLHILSTLIGVLSTVMIRWRYLFKEYVCRLRNLTGKGMNYRHLSEIVPD
jgi:hypothetical protein